MKFGDEWLEGFWKALLIVLVGGLLAGLIIPFVVMR